MKSGYITLEVGDAYVVACTDDIYVPTTSVTVTWKKG